MPITIESMQEWEERQGERVFTRGQYIFESGAVLSAEGGMRWEPPEDERQRLKMQLDYWSAKIDQATKDYSAHLHDIQDRVNLSTKYANLPIPDEAEFKAIKSKAEQIEQLKQKRAEIKAMIQPTVAMQRRDDNQRQHSNNIANAHKHLSSLPKI